METSKIRQLSIANWICLAWITTCMLFAALNFRVVEVQDGTRIHIAPLFFLCLTIYHFGFFIGHLGIQRSYKALMLLPAGARPSTVNEREACYNLSIEPLWDRMRFLTIGVVAISLYTLMTYDAAGDVPFKAPYMPLHPYALLGICAALAAILEILKAKAKKTIKSRLDLISPSAVW